MTDVTVTGTPSSTQRPRAPMTVRQLPAPRKASWSRSVGKSSETSTLWKRLSAASSSAWMLRPLEVMLVLSARAQIDEDRVAFSVETVLAEAEGHRARGQGLSDTLDVPERQALHHHVR